MIRGHERRGGEAEESEEREEEEERENGAWRIKLKIISGHQPSGC